DHRTRLLERHREAKAGVEGLDRPGNRLLGVHRLDLGRHRSGIDDYAADRGHAAPPVPVYAVAPIDGQLVHEGPRSCPLAQHLPATCYLLPANSYRAFPLAALDLVGLRAAPVNELVEGGEAELDRHR